MNMGFVGFLLKSANEIIIVSKALEENKSDKSYIYLLFIITNFLNKKKLTNVIFL